MDTNTEHKEYIIKLHDELNIGFGFLTNNELENYISQIPDEELNEIYNMFYDDLIFTDSVLNKLSQIINKRITAQTKKQYYDNYLPKN